MTQLLNAEKSVEAETIYNEGQKHGVFMTVGDHIEDFRKRLIYIILGVVISIVICLLYGSKLIYYVREMYASIMISEGLEPRLQSLAPSDGFITYLKITSLAGIALSSPWIFYHLWRFIAAGLYPKEKRLVHFIAPASVILFISGAAFFFMFIAPLTLRFFIRFNKTLLGIDSAFTFEKYISFITNMTLVFGLSFQFPIVIFFLNKTGIVSLETFAKSRRYVLLIVFILAAVLTPGPDVISQVSLAIPLYLLFEIGILFSRLLNK